MCRGVPGLPAARHRRGPGWCPGRTEMDPRRRHLQRARHVGRRVPRRDDDGVGASGVGAHELRKITPHLRGHALGVAEEVEIVNGQDGPARPRGDGHRTGRVNDVGLAGQPLDGRHSKAIPGPGQHAHGDASVHDPDPQFVSKTGRHPVLP